MLTIYLVTFLKPSFSTAVSAFHLFQRYLQYYWRAQTYRRVQTPLVSEFAQKVLEDRRFFYAFEEVEALRHMLLKDKQSIQVSDFGAGSRLGSTQTRRISRITKNAATSPAYCQLLFRLIQWLQPETLLELGTSLGIASLYQAKAASSKTLHTIEGCPQIAARAQQHFDLLKAKNIELHIGSFETVLPEVLQQIDRLDYVFFDGNHQYEPTLRYFEQCLPKANEHSVFIFDDIYWSTEMERAWATIKQHEAVTLTIDLFFFGLVFFQKQDQKQAHLTLIPSRWKPI